MDNQEQEIENNAVVCPKAPDEEIMRMLIRANHFLGHVKEHSIIGTDFDVMISIHNLDNALEYILRILIKHFDVENLTGKTIDTCEIDTLIGELKKFFSDYSLPALPFVQEIKLIRKQRNLVQHAITNPAADLKLYIGYGDKFFARVLNKYFGISISDLSFSTLITDEFVKTLVEEAERSISERKYLEAIVAIRDAFDYSLFQNPLYHSERLWNPPAIAEARNHFIQIPKMISNMYDLLSMAILEVDMPKYNRYREYIEYIPTEYGHSVKQEPWKIEDAEFCYLFVCETILHWQSFNTTRVDNPEPSNYECTYIEEFEGIRIDTVYEEKGCLYFDENRTARLFYLDSKDKVDVILSHAKKKYLSNHIKTLIDGKQNETESVVRIHGVDHKLVMNNPKTWQIYILYDFVPFASHRLVNEDQANLDTIRKDAVEYKIVSPYLPIDSEEKAAELEEVLKMNGLEPDKYYSSKLIEKLTARE